MPPRIRTGGDRPPRRSPGTTGPSTAGPSSSSSRCTAMLGTPEQVIERLRYYESLGVDEFQAPDETGHLTKTGMLVATVHYLPQADRGRHPRSPGRRCSTPWSPGAALPRATPAAIMNGHLSGAIPDLATGSPPCPPRSIRRSPAPSQRTDRHPEGCPLKDVPTSSASGNRASATVRCRGLFIMRTDFARFLRDASPDCGVRGELRLVERTAPR